MTKVYKAYVYQDYRGFTGEIEGININTNVVELKNTPVDFYADSKQELLADMVKFLKGTGHAGILRVANQTNIESLTLQELYALEEKVEADYRAAKHAYHAAFNNGVDIGRDAVLTANLRLNAIREQIYELDHEEQRIAKYDAISRSNLMLDDA